MAHGVMGRAPGLIELRTARKTTRKDLCKWNKARSEQTPAELPKEGSLVTFNHQTWRVTSAPRVRSYMQRQVPMYEVTFNLAPVD